MSARVAEEGLAGSSETYLSPFSLSFDEWHRICPRGREELALRRDDSSQEISGHQRIGPSLVVLGASELREGSVQPRGRERVDVRQVPGFESRRPKPVLSGETS